MAEEMSKRRGLVCRDCRWKLFLAAVVGGFVGAAAGDLGSWLFAASTDPWVAECETMREHERNAGQDRSYFIDGELCVAIIYPELPDRDLLRDDAPYLGDSAFRTVLDSHGPALRASQGGEVRIRFQVDAGGAPVDPEISESSGSAAVEAFALDLATTMTFSAVTGGVPSATTWAEFPVSIGVRPRE